MAFGDTGAREDVNMSESLGLNKSRDLVDPLGDGGKKGARKPREDKDKKPDPAKQRDLD